MWKSRPAAQQTQGAAEITDGQVIRAQCFCFSVLEGKLTENAELALGSASKADRQPVFPAARPGVQARRVPESAAGRGSPRGAGPAPQGSPTLRAPKSSHRELRFWGAPPEPSGSATSSYPNLIGFLLLLLQPLSPWGPQTTAASFS